MEFSQEKGPTSLPSSKIEIVSLSGPKSKNGTRRRSHECSPEDEIQDSDRVCNVWSRLWSDLGTRSRRPNLWTGLDGGKILTRRRSEWRRKIYDG